MNSNQTYRRCRISKAKTPMVHQLQKAFEIALKASSGKIDSEVILGERNDAFNHSRRKFLEQSTKGLLALSAGSFLLSSCSKTADLFDKPNDHAPKIVIVGGGLAGLNCAYTLKNSNINATIYEANTRTGGRIYTAKDIMGPGLTTELGGEFIDSGHTDMRMLAAHFGFNLLDVESPANNGFIKDAYFFNGQHYTELDVINAFVPIAAIMQADIDKLPDTITYDAPGAAKLFDHISLEQYISKLPCEPWMKSFLNVAFITEYGLDAGQQSCINMLYLISTDTSGGKFEIFGDSDERYKIDGGNQKITDALTQNLSKKIKYEHKLDSVNQFSNGKYQLTFRYQNTSIEVNADYVVFAIPFSILRNVHFAFKLPAWKWNAIKNLGYGTNAKLMVGFNNRPWRTLGYRGYAFTNNSFQNGWDNSELQAPNSGGYTIYTGGTTGVNLGVGSAQSQLNIHLPGLEQVFPGCTTNLNGKVARMHWPTAPFVKASYACYKTGQFSTIAGAEAKRVDRLFFAGEHCSLNYQGFMNGAAETGRKAAQKIIAEIS